MKKEKRAAKAERRSFPMAERDDGRMLANEADEERRDEIEDEDRKEGGCEQRTEDDVRKERPRPMEDGETCRDQLRSEKIPKIQLSTVDSFKSFTHGGSLISKAFDTINLIPRILV